MNGQVRSYVRVGVDDRGLCVPVAAAPLKGMREKPFAAEYALLAELGLGE
jgi:hypothetical protein